MESKENASTLDVEIQRDKMRLTVTNVYPVCREKSKLQVRQEISAGLYQIFKKYV